MLSTCSAKFRDDMLGSKGKKIMAYCVYILTNKRDGVLYTGVTSDLLKRVHMHKSKILQGFSSKYKTSMLVYYEIQDEINVAILREKQIKRWRREWKTRLIAEFNPE